METRSALKILIASVALAAASARAVPIGEVAIDTRYSVSGLGENWSGVVIRIDRSAGKALVRYDNDQRTEWVSASRLIRTEGESAVKDFGEAVIWLGLGAIVLCGLTDCADDTSSSTSTGSFAAPRLLVHNECRENVDLRLVYRDPDGEWNTRGAVWSYSSGERAYPTVGEDRIVVSGDSVFMSATSASFVWSGSSVTGDDRYQHSSGDVMKRVSTRITASGDRLLRLTCG